MYACFVLKCPHKGEKFLPVHLGNCNSRFVLLLRRCCFIHHTVSWLCALPEIPETSVTSPEVLSQDLIFSCHPLAKETTYFHAKMVTSEEVKQSVWTERRQLPASSREVSDFLEDVTFSSLRGLVTVFRGACGGL